ncbi:hypothetical protein [Parablautia intestinalis]|nr:hypothetical protein [Parablautia intestinalis]
MAVTSLWHVKGSIKDLIDYIVLFGKLNDAFSVTLNVAILC